MGCAAAGLRAARGERSSQLAELCHSVGSCMSSGWKGRGRAFGFGVQWV